MFIQEVSKMTGVSVRTLRYYDEIGLLRPDEVTAGGYRVYREPALRRLQQILFYRELEVRLEDISRLLDHPNLSEQDILSNQLQLMKLKQARLEGIIRLLEQRVKGEPIMSFQEFSLDDIKAYEEQYREEVEEKYGESDAYKESQKRTGRYTKDDWSNIQTESGAIYEALAAKRQGDPGDDDVQALVGDWQALISRYFYPCSDEMLAGLGEMYQADERFRANIDQYGEGLTDFLSEAIRIFTKSE